VRRQAWRIGRCCAWAVGLAAGVVVAALEVLAVPMISQGTDPFFAANAREVYRTGGADALEGFLARSTAVHVWVEFAIPVGPVVVGYWRGWRSGTGSSAATASTSGWPRGSTPSTTRTGPPRRLASDLDALASLLCGRTSRSTSVSKGVQR